MEANALFGLFLTTGDLPTYDDDGLLLGDDPPTDEPDYAPDHDDLALFDQPADDEGSGGEPLSADQVATLAAMQRQTIEDAVAQADSPKAVIEALTKPHDDDSGLPVSYIRLAAQQDMDTATEWLLDGLLATRTVGILSGMPGTRKSFLTLDLAVCLANGVPSFLGHEILRHGPVVYLAADDGARRTVGRLRGIAKYRLGSEAYNGIAVVESKGYSFADVQAAHTSAVYLWALARSEYGEPPALMVFDTAAMCGSPVEDFGHSVPQVMAWVKEYCRDLNCAVLVLDHQAKAHEGIDVRSAGWGSTLKAGFYEFGWMLESKNGRLRWEGSSKDGPDAVPLLLRFSDDYDKYSLDFEAAVGSDEQVAFRMAAVEEKIRQGFTTNDGIKDALGRGRTAIKADLDKLVRVGRVRLVKESKGRTPAEYGLADSPILSVPDTLGGGETPSLPPNGSEHMG